MHIRHVLILLILAVFTQDSFSLVDYTEDNSSSRSAQSSRRSRPAVKRNAAPRSVSRSSGSATSASSGPWLGMIDLKTQYLSEDVELGSESAKIHKYNFDLHAKLGQSIYTDIRYQMIKSDSDALTTTSQYQKGNPEAVLGLNWINFGERGNKTNVDFLVGHRWGVMGSELASSRSDFIVGLQTFKSIGPFAIGFGYNIDLTGNPQSAVESYVGNIHTLKGSLGWVVSPDIRMALHAQRITIKASSEENQLRTFENDLIFTIINPELSLSLGQMVDLSFGGYFRSQREEFVSGYEQIKAPQYNALWGNSIYTGLNISL